jgi:WD40 repeat protein
VLALSTTHHSGVGFWAVKQDYKEKFEPFFNIIFIQSMGCHGPTSTIPLYLRDITRRHFYQLTKARQTFLGHTRSVESVAFHHDGKTLASASRDRKLKLWDADSGQERATLQGHSSWVTSVAFSPVGKTLASASSDATIKLWEN